MFLYFGVWDRDEVFFASHSKVILYPPNILRDRGEDYVQKCFDFLRMINACPRENTRFSIRRFDNFSHIINLAFVNTFRFCELVTG